MTYYGIYKITNLLNGKMYIGKHKTNNIDDGYMGSGKYLKNAINKYGVDNLRKEWLMFCEDEEEMNYMERVFVDKTWVDRSDTYNLKIGGEGGSVFGRKHSEETIKKMSESHKGNKAHLGHHHTDEVKLKISKAKKGKKLSEDTRQKMSNARKLENLSDETILKRHEGLCKAWKRRKESGEEIKSWNRGKKGVYSEETLKKMSESISKAKKGKPSNRKGVRLSEETRKKMSESHKKQKIQKEEE